MNIERQKLDTKDVSEFFVSVENSDSGVLAWLNSSHFLQILDGGRGTPLPPPPPPVKGKGR